ncbi:MAG: hypothetical protein JWO02_4533, partial [Solirubrobacterales bacterium]|nr:hypothetical protein [Solirubrobacterales bacterium]
MSPLQSRVARWSTAAALTALALCGSAQANSRYAAPDGGGSACTQVQRCSIVQAVNGNVANPVHSGDEVIVGPGIYPSTATVLNDQSNSLQIHGEAGEPRPVLISSAVDGIFLRDTSRVSQVELQHSGTGHALLTLGSATADHVIVRSSANGAIACATLTSITDSVCAATGTNGRAFEMTGSAGAQQNISPVLRGVTAEATGFNGVGISVDAGSQTTIDLHATNVIAHGPAFDVKVLASAPTGVAAVTLDHSNYADVIKGAGNASVTPAGSPTNKVTPPVFVNAAGGNFRQAAGSVGTIDHGAAGPFGATDLDGFVRPIGAAPDIGAFEHALAPTVSAGEPTDVTTTAATLVGATNPRGAPTFLRFAYTPDGGPTTTTDATAMGAGTTVAGVERSIGGLAPGTHYTVTATAVNGGGSVTSAVREFTTQALAPGETTPVTPGSPDTTPLPGGSPAGNGPAPGPGAGGPVKPAAL